MPGSGLRSIFLLAALTAALLLAACGDSDSGDETGASTPPAEATTAPDSDAGAGGEASEVGDEASGVSDEQQVEDAITALLTDPDKEFVCNEVFSQELLEAAYGDLRGCLNGRAPEGLADSVKGFGTIEVSGDTASAEVVPDGGLYDGETMEIEAVRDGEDWRIDLFVADLPVGP